MNLFICLSRFDPRNMNKAVLVFGDAGGGVYCIVFQEALGSALFGAQNAKSIGSRRVPFQELLKGLVKGIQVLKFSVRTWIIFTFIFNSMIWMAPSICSFWEISSRYKFEAFQFYSCQSRFQFLYSVLNWCINHRILSLTFLRSAFYCCSFLPSASPWRLGSESEVLLQSQFLCIMCYYKWYIHVHRWFGQKEIVSYMWFPRILPLPMSLSLHLYDWV